MFAKAKERWTCAAPMFCHDRMSVSLPILYFFACFQVVSWVYTGNFPGIQVEAFIPVIPTGGRFSRPTFLDLPSLQTSPSISSSSAAAAAAATTTTTTALAAQWRNSERFSKSHRPKTFQRDNSIRRYDDTAPNNKPPVPYTNKTVAELEASLEKRYRDNDNFFPQRPVFDPWKIPKKKPKLGASNEQQRRPNTNIPADEFPAKLESPPPLANRMRQEPPRPRVLLDSFGNPRLFTLEEAANTFEDNLHQQQDSSQAYDDSTSFDETQSVLLQEIPPIVAMRPSNASWESLGVTSDVLLSNLHRMKCSYPLTVQQETVPPILAGRDVLVGTYTGSGKTLAFLAPLVERLLNSTGDPGLAVLVVAPGRELASQIAQVAKSLLEGTQLVAHLAIGGTAFSKAWTQIRKKKPNILVGTPGRIAELLLGQPGDKRGFLKTSSIQALVLDEFDALLDYAPHREPTYKAIEHLHNRRGDSLQNVLCSATAADIFSDSVHDFQINGIPLLKEGYVPTMTTSDGDALVVPPQRAVTPNPTENTTTDAAASSNSFDMVVGIPPPQVSRTVLHGTIHVPGRHLVLDTLRRVLHTKPYPQQVLIFVESAHRVEVVVQKLAERGIIAAPLHGGQASHGGGSMTNQKLDRKNVSKALREGKVGMVVATELAARGLDAPFLTHVINMDLPTDTSHYAHRAGRCGRGGRPGIVLNLSTGSNWKVPFRFAQRLGIEMHHVEARDGQLLMIEPPRTTPFRPLDYSVGVQGS